MDDRNFERTDNAAATGAEGKTTRNSTGEFPQLRLQSLEDGAFGKGDPHPAAVRPPSLKGGGLDSYPAAAEFQLGNFPSCAAALFTQDECS